jgi:sigma-B regulation protein RsbU (phosphoserine phosphatase)
MDRTTRLDGEMNLARRVMQGLLPRAPPSLEGFDIAIFHEWSRDVSGDYYDFIPLGDGRWGLVVADVVGKGIAAALLVSAIQASLTSLAGLELALRAIFRRANRFLRGTAEHDRDVSAFYATVFYGVLDVPSRRLIYVNAGHLPALLVRSDGTTELLEEGGIPLGLFDDPHYYEGFARMLAGDVLALYTDGVTEAADGRDEPYGVERLTRVLQDARGDDAASIRDAVVADLRGFSVAPRADDETLVILKATGEVSVGPWL